MSKPVSAAKLSRMCRAGFELMLYASFRISNCFCEMVVRGRLLISSNSSNGRPTNVRFPFLFDRFTFVFQGVIIEFTDEFLIFDEIKFVASVQSSMAEQTGKTMQMINEFVRPSNDFSRWNSIGTTGTTRSEFSVREKNSRKRRFVFRFT